ncbi:MAG: dipeptidase [Armatimonadetes bacterium]|nr:dipeptidase [Armatimonadota bacterium]
MQKAIAYARERRVTYLDQFRDWLRIPSISALPEHGADCVRAAQWLAGHLREIGLPRVEVIPSQRNHPLVYAEHARDANAPTVLFYGHYDVQPVDPLELWTTPPFEPAQRGDRLYARGASDDKGQVFAAVKAIEAMIATHELPVNVKLLVEGQEESGGEEIHAYVPRHRKKLAADCALVLDSGFFAAGVPAITVGLRGILYTEIEIQGPKSDLHSGVYGGAVPNPFHEMVRVLALLHDKSNRVRLPGFYRAVREPSEEELRMWRALPGSDADLRAEVGAEGLTLEDGRTSLECRWSRPTLEIHGVGGGFSGAGGKTVLPAKALAKVSMRLVPDQKPEAIFKSLDRFVRRQVRPAYRVDVRKLSTGRPWVVSSEEPAVRAAAQAWTVAYGAEAKFIRVGGSVPIVDVFKNTLRLPVIVTGFGMPDDNLHAPNEKVELPAMWDGVDAVIRFFHEFARTRR